MFIAQSSIFYMYLAQNLIGCRVDMKGIFLKKKYYNNLHRTHEGGGGGVKLKLGIHAQDISLYINCVYCSSRIRTLVECYDNL